jgi:hypothetical protein
MIIWIIIALIAVFFLIFLFVAGYNSYRRSGYTDKAVTIDAEMIIVE